jgi:predicted dehydrogenase
VRLAALREFGLDLEICSCANKVMNKPFQISRRSFVKRCAATAAATGLPLWFVERELAYAQDAAPTARPSTSPNSRPGIALIGMGGRMGNDGGDASRHGDILAVCDVDEGRASSAARRYTSNGKTPAKFGDFRKAIAVPGVDIVVQATPDHWHTLVNLAAAKARKDIFSEKPLTLTLNEGPLVVKAVRENKVVFQTGTQQRSDHRFHLACELVRNEVIGKLKTVTVWVPAGLKAGPFKTVAVPAGFDWDFWLGQAPKEEYLRERCQDGNFRWWWDYSGGPVTDWGAHHNDIARWGIGQDGPIAVEATVLTPPIPGGYTTPSTYEATLTWANGITQYVKTTLADSPYGQRLDPNGQRNGIKFEGTNGWIWVNRDEIKASDDDVLTAKLPAGAMRLDASTSNNHVTDFFNSVVSRKDPISSVESGHRSASVGHLIVIALRTGHKLQWDPAKEVFIGENAAEGNAMASRPMRAPYDLTM